MKKPTALPKWSTACPDWERRIVAGKSLVPFAPLFPEEAEAALNIFRQLKLVDVPGMPSIGDACKPWVFEFVEALFGAYDPAGRRLINEFFLLISKKNGKSTIAAAIMVTALLLNWRNSALFIILAPSLEAADNAAEAALTMVERDELLMEILRPVRHEKAIYHRTTGAVLKVLSADSDVVTGKKATGVLIDELHLFGRKHNAEALLREARGGLMSRPEGFVLALTTQSSEPPAGVFKQWLSRFRDIRDGKLVAPKSFGVMYEFPQSMIDVGEHLLPENFYITNPNLGVSVDADELVTEYEKAKHAGEGPLKDFLAKHLNIEIGLNLRTDRWVGADYWEDSANIEPALTLDDILARCEVATIGVDGGGADDLLGLCVIGRERETRRWLCWAHAWAHPKAIERRKSEASRYEDFRKDGDLTIIHDYPDDITGVVGVVHRVLESGLLASVGLDQIGIGGLVEALAEIGVTEENGLLIGISQGYRLTGAIKSVERKLIDHSFIHANRPMMAWCLGNAKVEPTRNAFLITKQASGSMKIDPLMAMFDAAALMERNPEPVSGPSIYNNSKARPEGFLIL